MAQTVRAPAIVGRGTVPTQDQAFGSSLSDKLSQSGGYVRSNFKANKRHGKHVCSHNLSINV